MVLNCADFDLCDPKLEQRAELMRGPVGAWRVDRDIQLRMLETLGLRPEHRLLEIGCGPLQTGAPLIRYLDAGNYTGVDVSADRLATAAQMVRHFGLEGRGQQLLLSDCFGLDRLEPHSFDRVWSFQVVIHFSVSLVRRYMQAVATLLEPDGIGWFSARVCTGPFKVRGSWMEFPVTEAGSDFFETAAADAGLSCTSLGTLEEWGLPSERSGAKNWLFELRPSH